MRARDVVEAVGHWVVVKWSDTPDTVGLLIATHGDCQVFIPHTKERLFVELSQIKQVLGLAKPPKIK